MIEKKIIDQLRGFGVQTFYGTDAELNVFITNYDFDQSGILAYVTRISDSSIENLKERATFSIMFLMSRQWDATSEDVSMTQTQCYNSALRFLTYLNKGNILRPMGVRLRYVYEKTDDIICGVAILVDVEECEGTCL